MRKRPSSALASKLPPSSAVALAHADEAVAVGLASRCAGLGLVTVSSSACSAERDLDVRAAASVARGVGQRLLEDPVGRPVDARVRAAGGCRRSGRRRRARRRGGARRASRARRDREAARPAVRRAVLAENADELVDLAQRLACDLLDRLERGPRSLGILLLQQPRRAGLDEDHVDRVAGRVVEVAGDARALLGGREAALALGLPLGPQRRAPRGLRAASRRCRTRSPSTQAPPQTTVPKRSGTTGSSSCADAGGADVDDKQADDGRGGQPRPRLAPRAGLSARKKRATVGPSGGPSAYPRRVQDGAGRGGEREDGEGRAAPGDEREGREPRPGRRRADRGRVCSSAEPPAARQRERESEHAPRRCPTSTRSSLRFTHRG